MILLAGCQIQSIFTPTPPLHTFITPRPLPTLPPTLTAQAIQLAPTVTVMPSPTATPTPTSRPTLEWVGESVQGRAIVVHRYGNGDKRILLVGGIHGGTEANTVTLMQALRAHFEAHPTDVLPDVELSIIEVMNPDGYALGNVNDGRFNARRVDLNRNWSCEWAERAYWGDQVVSAGEMPFSEPETRAVAQFIQAQSFALVLFYHSAADGIFAGDCDTRSGEWLSGEMVAVYGEASAYPYQQPFTAYRVSGTAANWVDGLGIPSADVELTNKRDIEFERNLQAIVAVQCWLADEHTKIYHLCTSSYSR